MKLLRFFMRDHAVLLICTFLSPLVFSLVFWLYEMASEPLSYALLLYGVLWLAVWLSRFMRYRNRHLERMRLLDCIAADPAALPAAGTLEDADYRRMLTALAERLSELQTVQQRESLALEDYYTLWVHQIKTPIAAMKMLLQEQDTVVSRALEAELFRIEQYAEMALEYIRLESPGNDLVIRECSLDMVIRSCIRKYAPLFIAGNLRLDYEPVSASIITDEKWFSFLLEQLLSNAVKYTPSGSVAVAASEKQLVVSDTGIGIAPEDLPRIFEKGFTGLNGRKDRTSSGLGLYLCRLTAEKLGMHIRAESVPGSGTSMIVEFPEKGVLPE